MCAPLQDAANCYPSAKAMIDGIVDAKILPDDTGEYVKEILFLAPVRVKTKAEEGMTLTITPVRKRR